MVDGCFLVGVLFCFGEKEIILKEVGWTAFWCNVFGDALFNNYTFDLNFYSY